MALFQRYSNLNTAMIMIIFAIQYDYLILRLTHLPPNSFAYKSRDTHTKLTPPPPSTFSRQTVINYLLNRNIPPPPSARPSVTTIASPSPIQYPQNREPTP